MSRIHRLPLIASVLLFGCVSSARAKEGVSITEEKGKLRIEINGAPFTEYQFENVPRPFWYPLHGPGGAVMVRHWPMKEAPNEEHDHKHHRSLWFTHGEVNGQDFWSESDKAGKIVHEKFTKIESGSKQGLVQSRNRWVAKDGTVVCTDERLLRVYNRPDRERLFDFEITLHASNGDLVFGDTKEGTMAIRLAETMRFKGKVGQGHIVNSEGVRDAATWGKRAKWVDYYGPVDGKTVGVAIFDHPKNPRHPTWWHVRDYGLFAANPFGIHDFEKAPEKTGDLKVPAGQSITFRYRFYLHEGDEQSANVAARYEEYVREQSR
ncbi:MAG: PmoA family protein [Verrucomicrobiota bacterium]|jgi:hypothetical protein